MRIDLFKTSPDRAGRYFVKFEDGSTMRLYRQTVEDFGLYTGKELSEADMESLVEAAGANVAGLGIVIEKGFQEGGHRIRNLGYDLQSLAVIEWMDPNNGRITFRSTEDE